jgi:hypothetical protein
LIKSISNGYSIEHINNEWIYSDTKENINIKRLCKYCGREQSIEGYDGCLGYIPNVVSACCGHGIEKPYVVFENGEYKEFENIEEMKEYFKLN